MRVFRLLLLLLLLAPAAPAAAYSVLTHQSIIDSTWDKCVLPLLQQRYPGATAKQQNEAKSYAYGGAILQDMGYYPLGAELFTNLTHYVRSGDFVRNLLRQAKDRNEYAFALGALAHYASDNKGHPDATNLVLPNLYPERNAKYGHVVTYEQAPLNHTEVEFAFDVMQIATGRYRSQAYHKHIGFRVSKPLLESAFQQTYGLKLGQIFLNVDASIAAFRLAVNQVLPAAVRAAWYSQRKQIWRASPTLRRRYRAYKADPSKFEQEHGADFERPGFGARVLASIINLLPKIGPLRTYSFRVPTAEDGARFHTSYREALSRYCALANAQPTDTAALATRLPNTNLDTGRPTHHTDYILADVTYEELLRQLHKHKFKQLTPALKQNIQTYFAAGPGPGTSPVRYTKATEDEQADTRKNRKHRRQAQAAFVELQNRAQ
jgi:hypothetical protein